MAAIHVLLIEDNKEDIRVIRESLPCDSPRVQLDVVTSDEDAIRFLSNAPPHEQAARPSLILLGMQPPEETGISVLQTLQKAPMLRQIPVVVLTRSRKITELLRRENLHANSHVLKPSSESEFHRTIRAIHRFWLSLSVLPPQEGRC